MGQLLVVQGRDGQTTHQVFDKALARFNAVSGLQPCDQHRCGTTAIAKFPRLKGRTGHILHSQTSNTSICAAGCLFYRQSTEEAALQSLLTDLELSASGSVNARGFLQPGCLAELGGIFTLAIHEAISGDLRIVTDRL